MINIQQSKLREDLVLSPRASKCQNSWWGQAYVVEIICPLPLIGIWLINRPKTGVD